jgi:hypothetical protein
MPKRIQFRRDTADNWTFHNPRLMPGEIGLETDTQQFKIGDGDLDWEDLPYYMSLDAMEGALDDATEQAVLDATTLAAGYKDAAAGSAAAADVSADAAASSAIAAEASATAAEAVGTTTDGIVSALVADDASLTNDAIEALMSGSGAVISAMNTSARDALGTVPDGTTIYNTTAQRLETYDASVWVGTLSIMETLGASFNTYGAGITMGGGTLENAKLLHRGTASINNYAGFSVIDFVDGGSGYGTLLLDAAGAYNYEQIGSPTWAAEDTTNHAIEISESGIYRWEAHLVLKRNGGSNAGCEVYLRRDAGGTRTGGLGIRSYNVNLTRYDNIFHEFYVSWIFSHTGNHYYQTILTCTTTATNVSSYGWGSGYAITRIGDV